MWIIFLASAAAFGGIMLLALRFGKAKRRAAAISLGLPVLLQPVIFCLFLRLATCNGEDCGRLLFVGAGILSALVMVGGLTGAALAMVGYRWNRRRA